MKQLILTLEMEAVVKRCVWFQPPAQTLQNTPRLVAYVLTHGMPADTVTLRKQLSNEELKEALDAAPPGIYDDRSWAYWNLVVGRYEAPPLPVRSFD